MLIPFHLEEHDFPFDCYMCCKILLMVVTMTLYRHLLFTNLIIALLSLQKFELRSFFLNWSSYLVLPNPQWCAGDLMVKSTANMVNILKAVLFYGSFYFSVALPIKVHANVRMINK